MQLKTILFFFNDTATTEIYTLSLHDALPICPAPARQLGRSEDEQLLLLPGREVHRRTSRSEEHTSELQSQSNLVCRLLLEKKNGSSCAVLTACRAWPSPRFPLRSTRALYRLL